MPTADELTQAEMRAGSVLIFTGNVLHSGGRNMSNGPRIGLNLNYCLGWLRQEENQYLACPPHIAKTLDPELYELIGYSMPNFALGYYSDPELAMTADAGVQLPQVALGIKAEELA
jgi:ectoine hydroxylase-related dioxygenase (phytanoyl-CoA dioxygenase family)